MLIIDLLFFKYSHLMLKFHIIKDCKFIKHKPSNIIHDHKSGKAPPIIFLPLYRKLKVLMMNLFPFIFIGQILSGLNT